MGRQFSNMGKFFTTIRALLLATALLAVPVSFGKARDFPLSSCKSADGTITQLSGIDTDHASMVGMITEPDAIEYCSREVASEPPEQCAKAIVQELNGAEYRATANCPKHILESKTDQRAQALEQYILVRKDGEFFWKSTRTGNTLGNSCADGTPPLFQQFGILCPKETGTLELTSPIK